MDELFQFPCPVVQRVLAAAGGAGAVVCGHMVDRLPDRRVLPPIEAGRPLHAQFPVCAPVRMALNSALGSGVQHSQWNLRKVMLVRVGPAVQFKSSHTLMKGGPVCSQDLLGYIDHYSFDAASAALSRQKLAAYDRALGGLNKRGQQSEQELVELVTSMNARSQYRDLITLLYNVSAPAEEPQLSRHAWGLIQEARVCCPLRSLECWRQTGLAEGGEPPAATSDTERTTALERILREWSLGHDSHAWCSGSSHRAHSRVASAPGRQTAPHWETGGQRDACLPGKCAWAPRPARPRGAAGRAPACRGCERPRETTKTTLRLRFHGSFCF